MEEHKGIEIVWCVMRQMIASYICTIHYFFAFLASVCHTQKRVYFLMSRLKGFTLSELMIVITILAVVAILLLTSLQQQTMRGYDSKRKTDLAKIKVIFEDYYNDHNCYPTKDLWDAYDCKTKANGDFLKLYLQDQDIPCDPYTGERYLYITIPEGVEGSCTGYRMFAALTITTDPDIRASGCDPDPHKGCGYEPYKYNYGISMGGPIANPLFDFTAPTPTPTLEFPPGQWVCTPYGLNCQSKSQGCRDQLMSLGCMTFENGTQCTGYCFLRQRICQQASLCE